MGQGCDALFRLPFDFRGDKWPLPNYIHYKGRAKGVRSDLALHGQITYLTVLDLIYASVFMHKYMNRRNLDQHQEKKGNRQKILGFDLKHEAKLIKESEYVVKENLTVFPENKTETQPSKHFLFEFPKERELSKNPAEGD